jgi:outer membrane receptor protein involved in Fe transport
VGARYQDDLLYVEAFYFNNEISDGIRSVPVVSAAGDTVQTAGLDTYENVNLDEIVLEGFEVNADVRLPSGIGIGASFATLDAEDALDPLNPVGESYSTKVSARAGYRDPRGRFWGEWETRSSGKQKEAAIESGNPICVMALPGECELPSFVIHGVRGGVRLVNTGRLTHGLTIGITNLTNELYAETANASFFRPEPKRNVTITWDVAF